MNVDESIPLRKFARKTLGMDQEAFAARFPLVSFVVQLSGDGSEGDLYKTHTGQEPTVSSADGGDAFGVTGQFLHFLQKTDRNSFKGMVTIGRANNNDVVIPHPAVSKLHAFVRNDPQKKAYTFTDVGSTNGSFLEGKRLTQNRPYTLVSKDTIRLGGSVATTFFEPNDLHAYLDVHRRLGSLGN